MKRKPLPIDEETPFVVCHRRKNHPMLSPRVCAQGCPRLRNCPSYRAFLQPGLFDPLTLRRMKRKREGARRTIHLGGSDSRS